jgi:hypothetical protein
MPVRRRASHGERQRRLESVPLARENEDWWSHRAASYSRRVSTGGGEGDCGFDVETGSPYLVYADKVYNASLVASIWNIFLAHADSALRVLRGEQPTQDDLLDGETYYQKSAHCGRGSDVAG